MKSSFAGNQIHNNNGYLFARTEHRAITAAAVELFVIFSIAINDWRSGHTLDFHNVGRGGTMKTTLNVEADNGDDFFFFWRTYLYTSN